MAVRGTSSSTRNASALPSNVAAAAFRAVLRPAWTVAPVNTPMDDQSDWEERPPNAACSSAVALTSASIVVRCAS